ncbi:MAG: hypothetical protein RLZZ444_1643, partial [Pseudomonadota bacterium]
MISNANLARSVPPASRIANAEPAAGLSLSRVEKSFGSN